MTVSDDGRRITIVGAVAPPDDGVHMIRSLALKAFSDWGLVGWE